MNRILRLGTRRSALALTQSTWVKTQLEALHEGLTVELVGMDTQGDEVHQSRFSTEPLQTLDGKNFFVKELDEALLEGRTDFSVHSYKDLSLDRPAELVVAAIPPRENPRDIVLFHPDIMQKLATGKEIIVGSASPRRAQNTPEFLAGVLPSAPCSVLRAEENALNTEHGTRNTITIKPLRGNVTTRVKKLEEGQYDTIILAMAGLNRLGLDISKFPQMILPLDVCPTAPAQGALAIECRAADTQTRQLLAALHDAETAFHITREREVLRIYGGGCHQAFGATSIPFANGQALTFVRGKSDAGEILNHIEWDAPKYSGNIIAWDGNAKRKSNKTIQGTSHQALGTRNVFVAHYRAVTPEILPHLHGKRIWCSGVMSWQKLAEMGLWVEGCTENLGAADIVKEGWTVLTHEEGAESWAQGAVISTYRVEPSPQEAEDIETATHLYWGSGSQFARLGHLAKSAKHHACGAGKTAETLRAAGITPDIFPNIKEWRRAVAR
jgi:hydroxymethylbilane synthase